MARFFIDRPIFAWVIAIIIMLAGGLSITQLPISMYPNIAPPAVTVRATYPGASAKVIEDSVTQIIEQSMKGLDGLIYMSANSEASGRATITLTFDNSTNPDIAQVQVQNKLQLGAALVTAGRATTGRERQQVTQRIPAGRRLRVAGRQHEPERYLRLRHQHIARPDQSRAGRGYGAGVRCALRHAHLAGPEQAGHVWT